MLPQVEENYSPLMQYFFNNLLPPAEREGHNYY